MITTTMVFATAMRFATAEISTSMKLSAVAPSTVTVSAIGFTAESIASTVAAEVATIRQPLNADSSAAMEIPVTTEVVAVTEPSGTEIIAIMEVTEQSVTLVDVRMPVVEVIPGTDADEHAIHKIIRAPVAVGRATKRIIRIISVCADRGRIVVTVIRTNLDADRNLRLGIDCRYR